MEQKNTGRMVSLFLPDTNILIYALKGIEPYAGWVADKIKGNTLVLSSLVIAEYLSGASKYEVGTITLLVSKTTVLPVDLKVAEIGAAYKKSFSRKTKKVWLSDCLIAATCKVFGAMLVTSDKKDYPMGNISIVVNLN